MGVTVHQPWRLALILVLVKQPPQIHEAFVGNVLVVDADTFPLPTQEVGCIHCPCAAAVHGIKTLPA